MYPESSYNFISLGCFISAYANLLPDDLLTLVSDSMRIFNAIVLLGFTLYFLFDIIQSTQETAELVAYINPAQTGTSSSITMIPPTPL